MKQEQEIEANPEDAGKTELFVKGLSFDADENTLRSTYSEYGNLIKVKLIMGKDGYSKGIAFVEYDTHKSAVAALAGTNNTQILGREVYVEFS